MCFTLFTSMEHKREQWLSFYLAEPRCPSLQVRSSEGRLCVSFLVWSPVVQTEVKAITLELLNPSVHRRFLNGISICMLSGLSVPMQSRTLRIGKIHSFCHCNSLSYCRAAASKAPSCSLPRQQPIHSQIQQVSLL